MKKYLILTFCTFFIHVSFASISENFRPVGVWTNPTNNIFITFFNNNKLSVFSPAESDGHRYRYYLLNYELSDNRNYLTLSNAENGYCGQNTATEKGNLKWTVQGIRLRNNTKEAEFRPIGMNGYLWMPKEDLDLRNIDPLITQDKKILYDFVREFPRYSAEEEKKEWGFWDAGMRNLDYEPEHVVYVYEFETGKLKKGKYNYEYGKLRITFDNEKPLNYSVRTKTKELIEFRESGGKVIYLTCESPHLTWESKRGWEGLANLSKINCSSKMDENAIKAGAVTALLYLIFSPSESNSEYYQESQGTYHSDPRINSYMKNEHEAESRSRY